MNKFFYLFFFFFACSQPALRLQAVKVSASTSKCQCAKFSNEISAASCPRRFHGIELNMVVDWEIIFATLMKKREKKPMDKYREWNLCGILWIIVVVVTNTYQNMHLGDFNDRINLYSHLHYGRQKRSIS